MTTQRSSMPDPYAALDLPETSNSAPHAVPYAQPLSELTFPAVDAALLDAVRAAVGPYVPAIWRTRPIDSAETEIRTTFGTSERVTPLPAAPVPVESGESETVADVGAGGTPPELPWIDAFLEADEADRSVAASSSAWPLDEAGAAIRALADHLLPGHADESLRVAGEGATGEAVEMTSAVPVAPGASTPPLPMWGDDDLMDIMPVKSPRPSTDSGEHWAASARRETHATGHNEAAAQAFESLARRVRDGEILLPGYVAEMGDAAALALALASLLSVRR